MRKKLSLLLFVLLAIIGLTACGGGDNSSDSASAQEGEVELRILTWKAGQNEGAPLYEGQVERFNKEYEGEYQVILDGTPQDTYNDKLKALYNAGQLPTLYEYGSWDAFVKNLIKNEEYYDLAPWLDANPDIKNALIPSSLEYNTIESGEVVSMPYAIIKPIGSWYNTELFNPSKPIAQMTWSEFILELGDNKFAFETGNGWLPGLFISALAADMDGGAELLRNSVNNKEFITDFNTPMFIEIFTKMKDMYDTNGWKGAIGATYPDAANAFMSNQSSLVFNGSWITTNLEPSHSDYWSNGFDGENVDVGIFPNNVVLGNSDIPSYFINPDAPEDQIDAALAFLEFIYSSDVIEKQMLETGAISPNMENSDEYEESLEEDRFMSQMYNAVNEDSTWLPPFNDCISLPMLTEMTKLLPSLLNESVTPEEFAELMTEQAKQLQQ